jgi:REP element-mobilizing transposase RayT
MKINLLAFTTDPDLLSLLSALTNKREDFFSVQTGTAEELFENIDRQSFDAVLIDASVEEIPLGFLTSDLVEQQPSIKILLLPPHIDPESPELKDAIWHLLLKKPVTSEGLEKSLEEMFSKPPHQTRQIPIEQPDQPADFEPVDDHEPSLIEIIDAAEFNEPAAASMNAGQETQAEPITDAVENGNLHQNLTADQESETNLLKFRELRFSYCCVLIPRFPQQYLARDLADQTAAILPQVHLSRGWRVTGISVRPHFLQWFISLPADTSPVEAMREIRQRTSEHFYTHFPELSPIQQVGDFWAPGYLMMSGNQPVSTTIIREFIERTRSRQHHGD